MTTSVIAFSYPRRGLTGEFATFRLGARAAEKHPPGARVELVDSRSKKLIKRATVTAVYVGTLVEMAARHAHQAHNWKEHPDAERPALLIASMKKRYPPGRALDTSICSVIYLREETNVPTIVTHTYSCNQCHETTDLHVEDGTDLVNPVCEHCGSADTTNEA